VLCSHPGDNNVFNARCPRALNNDFAVVVKDFEIEMAVCVNHLQS
jgi:hypothetical protein